MEPDLGSHLPWVTLNTGTLGKLFNVSWPHGPSQQSGHHIASMAPWEGLWGVSVFLGLFCLFVFRNS